MKKFIFILSLLFIFTACDNDEGTAPPVVELTARDSIQIYTGNFISTENAAVLKGDQFIYQVVMDPVAISLRDSIKKGMDAPAIRPVTVKGKVSLNKLQDGYSHIIEIIEILELPNKEKTGLPINKGS